MSASALVPYLQRAEEMSAISENLVAYYCRLYALEKGMRAEDRDDGLLGAIMSQLEKDKPTAGLSGSSEEDSRYCQTFAMKIFKSADRADKAGKASKKTAQAYYAAKLFMDICSHFGEETLPDKWGETKKYALWRSAEITKAIKEGRAPEPPPNDGEEGGSAERESVPPPPPPPADVPATAFPPPTIAAPAPAPQPTATPQPHIPPQQPPSTPVTPAPPMQPTRAPGPPPPVQLTNNAVRDAHKLARYAVGSIGLDAIDDAVEYLRQAIALL